MGPDEKNIKQDSEPEEDFDICELMKGYEEIGFEFGNQEKSLTWKPDDRNLI